MPKRHDYHNKQTISLEDDDLARVAKVVEQTGLSLSEVNRTFIRYGLDHFGKKPMSLVSYRAKLLAAKTKAKKKAKVSK